MAQSDSAAGMRVERGSWVESDQPKKNGSGMRKLWVSGDDGDRLSVILRNERGNETHAISLHVGTGEDIARASRMLDMASKTLADLARAEARKPATIPAPPAKAPAKAPTPPPAPPAPPAAKPADPPRVACDHAGNAAAGAAFCPICGTKIIGLGLRPNIPPSAKPAAKAEHKAPENVQSSVRIVRDADRDPKQTPPKAAAKPASNGHTTLTAEDYDRLVGATDS